MSTFWVCLKRLRGEIQRATEYIEKWLLTIFDKNNFTPFFTVEQVHRIPTCPLPPGKYPRPFILKMLRYKDRENILALARTKGTIEMNGSKISFFPDFSVEVQKLRAQNDEGKRQLPALQIPYAMLYPTKQPVVVKGETHFFDTPKSAAQWLDRNEKHLPRAHPPS